MRVQTTHWECEHCGHRYSCVRGIPKLYVEENLGERDRALRDSFYDGFIGKYYQHVFPFLGLPVRPRYWGGWLCYGLIVAVLLALVGYAGRALFRALGGGTLSPLDAAAVLLLLLAASFLLSQRYLLFLLLLAVPVKLSLRSTRFRPGESFSEVHARLIGKLLERKERLEVLDVSTGSCNSLFRHGWMKLDAAYTGLDLSETMLMRGVTFMAAKQIPMEFVLGDAARLPFSQETFDVVLNYGALNGYADPGWALQEMARVTKENGLVLFLDEQLYESATPVEKLYFERVLSSHDLVHRCPVELIPPSLVDVTVHQIYHFYYLCTCWKRESAATGHSGAKGADEPSHA